MNGWTVAPLIHSRRDGNFLTAEEIARRKAKYAVVQANAVTPAVLTRIKKNRTVSVPNLFLLRWREDVFLSLSEAGVPRDLKAWRI